MTTVYYSNALIHHGVRGQKWGDRNGPPYPLTSSAHSAREKKAGWKKSLNKSDADNTKRKPSTKDDVEDTKRKGLTKEQKKALIIGGVAVVAGVSLVVYAKTHPEQIQNAKDLISEKSIKNL